MPKFTAGSRVVAVIPAHNEERFIGSVVIGARQQVDDVIVVDDGSADRTAMVAKEAGATVVRLQEQRGKGGALNAGFQHARRLNPTVVVTLDGDAQHDAAEIPVLVQPILDGQADLVIGSRFLGEKSETPAWRRAGQVALTVLTNVASGTACSDSQSGFRALSPAALQVLRFQSGGLAVESEMQFLVKSSALRVAEVPIRVQYRDGNKRNPVSHGLHLIDAILGMVARQRPLTFFALPGGVGLLAGIFLWVYVLRVTDAGGIVPIGTAVAATLVTMGGLLMVVTGVILNTLHRFTDWLRADIRELVGGVVAASPPLPSVRGDKI